MKGTVGRVIFAFVLAIGACFSVLAQNGLKTYTAFYRNIPIVVDGVLQRSEWTQAIVERDFSFPWREESAPSTVFYATLDDSFFNFAFAVKDRDIVLYEFINELDVAKGDRVEIFFSTDLDLESYYCLEIRPDGKVLDYAASYYRNFDETWDFEGLQVGTKINDSGYTVEGRIPLSTLKDLGIVPERQCFYIGLFRAEFSSSGLGTPEQKWISWVMPESAEADFHISTAFGQFCVGK